MNPQCVLTRYLYAKDEVELALLVAILNKSDDSLFWAYELHYSGFTQELFQLLRKIYYDFFATLNPAFEAYFIKKENEWLKLRNTTIDTTTDTTIDTTNIIIASIIQSLLFRPCNTDVFLLRLTSYLFEYDISYGLNIETIANLDDFREAMRHWIETNDYISLTQWILNINKNKQILDHSTIYKCCLELFQLTKGKIGKETFKRLHKDKDIEIVLLAKIMTLFSEKHRLKKGKSIYIRVDPESIILYETLCGTNELPHYRILEKACICGIDDLKHLGLFKLKRTKYNLRERYLNNWLFYASFSPLWSQRLTQFGGVIDNIKKTVLFEDDDLMEQFYELYGLEPDEQKKCVQQKSIVDIEQKYNWTWFCSNYRKNGLFKLCEEELAELDLEGVMY